jgi:hypothetical protein
MPLPTRPVAGATIATDWGQDVHDYTFAPAGVQAHSSAAMTMEGSNPSDLRKLHLDTVDEDPGGYLNAAGDSFEVPTDGGGYYLFSATVRTDNGASSDETNVRLRINVSEYIAQTQVGNEGATAIYTTLTWMGPLSAGDVLAVYARQIGAGARADVDIVSATLIRLGAELGAP